MLKQVNKTLYETLLHKASGSHVHSCTSLDHLGLQIARSLAPFRGRNPVETIGRSFHIVGTEPSLMSAAPAPLGGQRWIPVSTAILLLGKKLHRLR